MVLKPLEIAVVTALAALLLPTPSHAQIQASPRGWTGIVIDGTTMTVDYSRPGVRGRDIFGGMVPWDVVWTPGANWATTFETDKAIRLNGVEVPAGEYSVWAIPRPDRWLVMLNPEPRIFHFVKPDSSQATIHVAVVPERAEDAEMLTWSFSQVRGDHGVLSLHWDDTRVPLDIEVQPTVVALTAEEIATYVGTYEMDVVPADPTWPEKGSLEVFEEDGELRGRMSFKIHPVDDEVFDLTYDGGTRFSPGLYRDGEFFNVERGVGFDFVVEGERAVGFDFRAGDGSIFGEGRRADDG